MKKLPKYLQVLSVILISLLFILCLSGQNLAFVYLSASLPNYFTDLLEKGPMMVDCYLPTIAFVGLIFFLQSKSYTQKLKITRNTSIIISSLAFIDLIINLIMTSFDYGWIDGSLSYFHSKLYGQMVIELVIVLLIPVLPIIYYYYLKKIELKDDENIEVNKIKISNIVLTLFITTLVILLASFAYTSINIYFDNYLEPTWYGIIPTLGLCLLPLMCVVIYHIYRVNNKNIKVWLKGMLIISLTLLSLCVWVFIVYLINPRYIYESMQSIFVFGMVIDIPLGPLVAIIYTIICLLVASIKYLRFKHEEIKQTKETNEH